MSIELVGAGVDEAPGWFGKLPSHGDFLARRLPPAVRLCFDDWLQRALLQSRADLGDAWLPAWLASPLWRFVVAPGMCGEQAWMGVMMPSHDRVGRCFPLLLMAGVRAPPLLRDCLTLHADWFMRLEDLALSTLEQGFLIEQLDAALIALGAPPASASKDQSGAGSYSDMTGAWHEALRTGEVPMLARAPALAGRSAWWTEGSRQVAPSLALCRGLPAPARFAALIDGSWAQRGWAAAR